MYMVHRHGWHVGPGRLEMFGEQYDYPVNQQAPAGNARRIVFQNMRGNLRITGGDDPDIRISGRKTIRAFRKPDADQADRDTPIEITTEGDHIVVQGNQERVSGDRRVTADLEVTVPRAFAARNPQPFRRRGCDRSDGRRGYLERSLRCAAEQAGGKRARRRCGTAN